MDDAIRNALDLALRAREDQDRLPMRFSYGPRYGSEDLKDIGFKGPLKQGEHVISEYSADRDFQYPSVYEGITPRDLAAVMMAERLGRGTPPDVDDRAYAAAQRRIQEGRSPFYESGRDSYPKWSPDQEWEKPYGLRADGGSVDEMIERGEWSPFSGLKYRPAPEKLSSEPDIREYQLKRHAHEFEGAPEPVAPKRKVVIDAPLFGGKKELGNLPYDYADMANTVLNTLYGFKTAPLYSNPYTAPVGRALDAYETAKKIEEDPSAFSSYTAIPKLFKGATPLGLGAMGVGATIAAEDEENKAYGGAVADALRVANKCLKGGRINTKIDRDPDWDMGLWHGGTARR